jgi:hypothetical protein
VPGHIDKVHGVHLFGDHLFAFRARGTKVEVEIANQEWTCTCGARFPGSFDISQRFQVGMWDVTPHDKKSDVVHLQLYANDVRPPNLRLLDLIRIIAPPEECNPSLPDRCGG